MGLLELFKRKNKISTPEQSIKNRESKITAVSPRDEENGKVLLKMSFSDFKILYSIKNDNLNPGEASFFFYGLDKRDGRAVQSISGPDENGLRTFLEIDYGLLIETAPKANKDLSGLTPENWYEYCLLQAGDLLVFTNKEDGAGPYHEETRYGLKVTVDGYYLKQSSGSPMSGMFDDSCYLPVGFFADKTIDEVRNFIYSSAKFIQKEFVDINNSDLELLIKTDEYRNSKINQ